MAIFDYFSFFILFILICSTSSSYEIGEDISVSVPNNNEFCSKESSQDYCETKANGDISGDGGVESKSDETRPIVNLDGLERLLKFRKLLNSMILLLRGVNTFLSDYPPETIIGSYLRSSEFNFVVAMSPFFGKMYSLFENSRYVFPNENISMDTIQKAMQNMGNEDDSWIPNTLTVLTDISDRIEHLLEYSLSDKSINKEAKNVLRSLNELMNNQDIILPDDSIDMMRRLRSKLEDSAARIYNSTM